MVGSMPIVVEQSFTVTPETVWRAITKPNLMRLWYFEQIEDFRPEVGTNPQHGCPCPFL